MASYSKSSMVRFVVGYRKGKLFITEDRIQWLQTCLNTIHLKVIKNIFFQFKEMAKSEGQNILLKAVIGKTVRLKTRYLYDCIMS